MEPTSEFAADSPLEQDGFEPSVPLAKGVGPCGRRGNAEALKRNGLVKACRAIPWLCGNISYHAPDRAVLLSTTALNVEIGAQPTASISPATEGG